MRIRLQRVLFTLATFVVVWLVASPARAANALVSLHPPADMTESSVPASSRAPLCDPRGATTFAPPPQMQDTEVSLDTGLTLEDCSSPYSKTQGRHITPRRGPVAVDESGSTEAATLPIVAPLAAAARELQPVPVPSTLCPRPGVRSTVDRPPRS